MNNEHIILNHCTHLLQNQVHVYNYNKQKSARRALEVNFTNRLLDSLIVVQWLHSASGVERRSPVEHPLSVRMKQLNRKRQHTNTSGSVCQTKVL